VLIMAGETVITVVGNLTADPELRFTPAGAAVANFTVASTPRNPDRQSGEWKDGDARFLRCNIWRQAAENVAESLTRGARALVTSGQRRPFRRWFSRRRRLSIRVVPVQQTVHARLADPVRRLGDHARRSVLAAQLVTALQPMLDLQPDLDTQVVQPDVRVADADRLRTNVFGSTADGVPGSTNTPGCRARFGRRSQLKNSASCSRFSSRKSQPRWSSHSNRSRRSRAYASTVFGAFPAATRWTRNCSTGQIGSPRPSTTVNERSPVSGTLSR
jgi:hypothetical protein